MRNHSLQQAISNFAALFEFGALKASTAPAEFMDDARKEILCLRAELAALRERAERAEAEAAGLRADAERYRVARAKVCIVGDAFHVINLRPTYVAPDAAIEFDAAIDAARGGDK